MHGYKFLETVEKHCYSKTKEDSDLLNPIYKILKTILLFVRKNLFIDEIWDHVALYQKNSFLFFFVFHLFVTMWPKTIWLRALSFSTKTKNNIWKSKLIILFWFSLHIQSYVLSTLFLLVFIFTTVVITWCPITHDTTTLSTYIHFYNKKTRSKLQCKKKISIMKNLISFQHPIVREGTSNNVGKRIFNLFSIMNGFIFEYVFESS